MAEMAAERIRLETAKQRLTDYAGVEGVDEDGRQLDRREFQATKRSLEWLALCHAGHYRNRKVFSREILSVVGSFERQGLPDPHGIVMKVRRDGQAWFAYRKTVTGYYFAIGAVGDPNIYWYYDGNKPPSGFPSDKGGWSSHFGDIRDEWREESPYPR